MPYAVQTPVFEGPFDLLLHLILREQVDLYEVSLAAIVDAYLAELERLEHARPRGRHRVPADRRHAGRAEGAAPAARRRTTSTSTRSWPCGRSATCCSPACSSARRSRTRRSCSQRLRRGGRALRTRALVGLDERFLDLTPDLLEGVTAERPARRLPPCRSRPKPVPRVDLFHVAADPGVSVVDAVEELLDELPRAGRITFRELTAAFVERLEVVVRFLAVLELFKQGLVELEQAPNFGDIEIIWLGDDRRATSG